MASRDIYSGNILLEEKLYKNVLICDILHKHFVGSQLLGIWFNKIHGFIQIYDGTRYLVLLGHNVIMIVIIVIIILQESDFIHITLYL